MRFEAEPFACWHEEAQPLFRAHWEMVGRHKDLLPLDVDVRRWVAIEEQGIVAAFTARINWGLAGYALYLVSPSLNYRGKVCAYCHAIYIDPAELVGLKAVRFARFIQFRDSALKARGCIKTIMHMKLTHDFTRMLERLGYEPSERLAEKVL